MKSATPEQIRKLSAAWDATWTEWKTAQAVARDAWEAAWRTLPSTLQPWNPAWNLAWADCEAVWADVTSEKNAWDAVSALLACDFTSEPDFGQDRYRKLVAPWETVFGKIEVRT